LPTIAIGYILLLGIWLIDSDIYAQSLSPPAVKITSPEGNNPQVPVGEFVVSGTSSDNINADCTVYIDWNDLEPYQKVEATGAGGNEDFSNWTFTYTDSYHLISQGVNELTSKITCYSNPLNLTKHYSMNVTGIESPIETSPEPELEVTQEEEDNDDDTPILLPFASAADNDQDNTDENNNDEASIDDGSQENNDNGDDNQEESSNDNGDSFFGGDSFFDD
jgi:hypothetical protein